MSFQTILCLSYDCKASQAVWSKSKPADASFLLKPGWLVINN